MVQRTLIRPPSSRLGPLEESERQVLMKKSPVAGLYDEEIDRESAYENTEQAVGGASGRAGPAR